MSIIEYFFPKKPKDGATYIDNKLGTLIWDSNSRDWVGTYEGSMFSISYEKNRLQPSKQIIEYAYEIILNQGFLKECLKLEVEEFIENVPEIKNIPEQMDELNSLYIESIHINDHEKGRWTFICLGPELPERVWRMELQGTKRGGLGFDS